MAPQPATITVTFTANYTGLHRVCWRIGSSGAYDCTTTVGCTSGSTCTVDITVSVDNETCPIVTFEGYVQPTCELESSTNNRVPFSVDFDPDPSCKRYTVTCNNAPVVSITVTDGGSGYSPGSPPAVVITGGGGSGATATATVVGDAITSIAVDTQGSGYTSTPTVTIDPPSPGIQATATAVLGTCPEFEAPDCDGSSTGVFIPGNELQPGESVTVCKAGAPPAPLPSRWDTVESGACLCDCESVTIENTGGTTLDLWYQLCGGEAVQSTLGAGLDITLCIVTGSLITQNSTVTIVVNGAC